MFKNGKVLSVYFLILFSIPSIGFSKNNNSFSEAKRQSRIIWADHRETVYCGCEFDNQLKIDFKTCGYIPKNIRRAKKVEWEHIVPVSLFGKGRSCWEKAACTRKNGKKYRGRNCCEKTDPQFREMYSDLHNLVPIIGEVNGARRNFSFTNILMFKKTEIGCFNGCDIIIDSSAKNVEPRDEIKGLVARAHLYMAKTYSITLEPGQDKIMEEWNQKYPPSEWEKEWNSKIFGVTGKNNSFITDF